MTPYSERDGAIVLEMDDHGNVLRDLRCVFPLDTTSNKALRPVAMTFLNGNLALSGPTGFLALYSVPR